MKPFTGKLDFVRDLFARFRADDVTSLGAQLTYYLLLAFFPFLIFLVSLIGFARINPDELMADLLLALPAASGETVREVVDEVTTGRNGALLSAGMLGTIWAASNGVNAMIKALNKAYDEEETRPFWKVRAMSVAATLALGVVVLSSMLTLVMGKYVGEYLFRKLRYPEAFPWLWDAAKFAVPLAAMFLSFLLFYRIMPNRKLSWRDAVPGSMFATAGWIASSLLFSFYVNQFGNYAKTYGSLGGIVVLLVWLYWSSIILLMGGEINATVHFRRESRIGTEKDGRLRRPSNDRGTVWGKSH